MNGNTKSRAIEIREFNRFYTNIIGLANQTVLASPFSLAEVRVLLEIDSAGQCTASDLTKQLQIDPGYLSRMLTRLLKEQLVTKAKSLNDGRAQVLSLTDKGRETFQKLAEASTNQIDGILEQLSPGDAGKLVSHMKAIKTIDGQSGGYAITIRTQKPGDVGYIAYRHGVLYEKEYGLDSTFERYVLLSLSKYLEDQSGGTIWVAESGDQIAGFIGIVSTGENTAQLRWFLIEPGF